MSDAGSWAWRRPTNHNRLIALQSAHEPVGPVTLEYFGSSAFRLTAPSGLSLMIDPWRNPPAGHVRFFERDFPETQVDIGLSTHAHYDHDALHRLDASVLLDRPIGRYTLADVTITGIADKHVSDTSHSLTDWAAAARARGVATDPPDNARSFDNCLIVIETGGLRLLHWGDNRPDPPPAVWDAIGPIDVALLPIDDSRHILSRAQAETIAARLGIPLIIPHHYFVPGITTVESTLLPPNDWLAAHKDARTLDGPRLILSPETIQADRGRTICFGERVAF